MGEPAANDALGVLDRMTCILEAFDEDDRGLGISELAQRADLPKSTVSRLVATLVRQRYLERDGKRIHLGLRLFELGQLAELPRELRMAALPVMADLRSRTGASIHLAIRDGNEMVCIAVMRARASGRSIVRTGGRVPIHATALGKAWLAHAHARDVEEVLSSGLAPWTRHTIVDPAELRGQLDDIRTRAVATEVGEFDEGVSCAAGAVFAPAGGTLVGALSISKDADDFDAAAVAPLIRAAAHALTRRLAFSGPGAE
ncbi:MAG: IclR family transcriptional regulator [Microbacterium sp.]